MDGSFRIGEWLVEPLRNRLARGDTQIKLDPKTMQVLVYLAGHADDVARKEKIIEAVWEEAFVTDEVLTNAVWELRKVLGDDAKDPQYIQTVPRKGYRLIAPVQVESEEELEQIPKVIPPASMRRKTLWITVGIVLAGLSITAWLYFSRQEPEPAQPRTVPVTSWAGLERQPAISPDGNQVVFVWDGGEGGPDHVYVKLIEGGDALQLTDDPLSDHCPTWSPDGTRVAFLRALASGPAASVIGSSAVFVIPALGGTERQLATVNAPRWLSLSVVSPGLDWSPDGSFLATVEQDSANGVARIVFISTETAKKRRLDPWPPGDELRHDSQPVFSPDGEAVAFIRGRGMSGYQIYVQPLVSGKPTLLTDFEGCIFDLDWTADGSGIVYSTSTDVATGLWMVSSSGGESRQLSFGGNAEFLSIAATGNRLAYSEFSYTDIDIWRIPGPASTERVPAAKLIDSSRLDWTPEFSPDGTRIAFVSERAGPNNIWLCDSDGANLVQLTHMAVAAVPRWSHDGKRIAFQADAEGTGIWDTYVLNVDEGFPIRLTHQDSQSTMPTDWSHDGQWIYIASFREGPLRLWKMPVDGGEPVPISHQRGGLARESPDGRFLYFLPRPQNLRDGLWRVGTDGSDERLFLERQFRYLSWDFWGPNLVYYNTSNNTIELFDVETEEVTSIAVLEDEVAFGFSVSQDGQWILYGQVESEDASDIMLVEDFR